MKETERERERKRESEEVVWMREKNEPTERVTERAKTKTISNIRFTYIGFMERINIPNIVSNDLDIIDEIL